MEVVDSYRNPWSFLNFKIIDSTLKNYTRNDLEDGSDSFCSLNRFGYFSIHKCPGFQSHARCFTRWPHGSCIKCIRFEDSCAHRGTDFVHGFKQRHSLYAMSHGERVLSLVYQNPPLCPDVVCRVVKPPVSGGGARQFDLDRPASARRKFQDQVDFSACVVLPT